MKDGEPRQPRRSPPAARCPAAKPPPEPSRARPGPAARRKPRAAGRAPPPPAVPALPPPRTGGCPAAPSAPPAPGWEAIWTCRSGPLARRAGGWAPSPSAGQSRAEPSRGGGASLSARPCRGRGGGRGGGRRRGPALPCPAVPCRALPCLLPAGSAQRGAGGRGTAAAGRGGRRVGGGAWGRGKVTTGISLLPSLPSFPPGSYRAAGAGRRLPPRRAGATGCAAAAEGRAGKLGLGAGPAFVPAARPGRGRVGRPVGQPRRRLPSVSCRQRALPAGQAARRSADSRARSGQRAVGEAPGGAGERGRRGAALPPCGAAPP